MVRRTHFRPLLVAAVAVSWFLVVGCDEYLVKPGVDEWTVSSVPGHLAIVFSGEGDSSDVSYEFSNLAPARAYTLARLMLQIQLEEGNAQIWVTYASGTQTIVDTGLATPGFGPWVTTDLEENLPGKYDVRIKTQDAKGLISVNIDEVDPGKANARIGFEYNCTFPDSYNIPVDRAEIYTWSHSTTLTPTINISASQLNTDQSILYDIRDGNDAYIGFFFGVKDSGVYSPRTCPFTDFGTAYEHVTGATANTEGESPISGGAATGHWKIRPTYTQQRDDASIQIRIELN